MCILIYIRSCLIGCVLLHVWGFRSCMTGAAKLACLGSPLFHELVSGRVALVRSASGVAEQARACLLAGEWAVRLAASGLSHSRRVGE